MATHYATHPRSLTITGNGSSGNITSNGPLPAHAPAASAARRAARTLAAWARGPLTRAARRGADIALLALGLATIAIGIGLAYRPAGIVFAGLAIIYIQIWLAAAPAAPPAPPAPRRIDQP